DRRLIRRLPDQLDRRPYGSLPGRDHLPFGQRPDQPDVDRRHRRTGLRAARVRGGTVGGPRSVSRAVAADLRPSDPDAAPDPALGARPADADRPGRGAVHRAPVAPPAGPADAGSRREPRADPFRDAVPAGRERGPDLRLVRALPGPRTAPTAAAASRPGRQVGPRWPPSGAPPMPPRTSGRTS